ncbi:MAG: histidine kinase [Bacteroidetes bacterium]|nr:histidine kinase [Bacteroidota bacterium]
MLRELPLDYWLGFGAVLLSTILSGIWFVWLGVKRKRYLKLLKSLRSSIASDLHDEVGAALSSVSFYSEAALRHLENGNTEKTAEILRKMGTQSRSTIESMSDIVWMINPGNDSFQKLLDRIENFGHELFGSKGVTFMFYKDEAVPQLELELAIRKNLFLICKEALHNSAKYSQAKTVQLLMSLKSGRLDIVITDDGQGFNQDEVKAGNGLASMRVRAQQLGTKLLISSKTGTGTTLSFAIKYPHKW